LASGLREQIMLDDLRATAPITETLVTIRADT
jgi:hypothetical protein